MFRNLDNSTCGMSANGSNYNVTHNIFVLTSGSPALSLKPPRGWRVGV
jgi:hypothetical protein